MTAGRHTEGTLSSIRTRSLQFLSTGLHACSCGSSNDAGQRITGGSKTHLMFSQSTPASVGLLIRPVWCDGCVLPTSSFLAFCYLSGSSPNTTSSSSTDAVSRVHLFKSTFVLFCPHRDKKLLVTLATEQVLVSVL